MTHPLIDKIVLSEKWEAEWIDLLSQMEYVGLRKIVKAVRFDQVDLQVLTHISEESSHAFLLKSILKSMGREGKTWVESLWGQWGWQYFSELDTEISGLIDNDDFQKIPAKYALVSWAVEERVLSLYPEYLEKTKLPQVKRAIIRIMAQEQKHSSFFSDILFSEGIKKKARDIENQLWDRLVTKLLSSL
jgi:hypothetical protein